MDCETLRTKLLEYDWDADDRRLLTEFFGHLGGCQACQAALESHDQLRTRVRLEPDDAEPAEGWAAFEDRLIQKLWPVRTRRHFIPGTLAAAVALALIGWGMYWSTLGAVTKDTAAASAAVPFTPAEVAERVQIFEQVSDVFNGRTGWVSLTDGESDLGLLREGSNEQSELLLLRLTISRNDSSICRVDLAIVPGQGAEVTAPSLSGEVIRVKLHTSGTDPARVRLWVQVSSSSGADAPTAVLVTSLTAGAGGSVIAGDILTDKGRYRVGMGSDRVSLRKQHHEHL